MLEQRSPQAGLDAVGFWEACDRNELIVQRCQDCNRVNWFPRFFCCNCSSSKLEWNRCTGNGVVESFTVVHRPMNAAYADEVPYVLALVRAEEGHLLVTRIVGDNALQTSIGSAVHASFVKTPGHALPVFSLDA